MTLNRTEIIIASLTALILFYIIIPKEDKKIKQELVVTDESPIQVKRDTHETWDGSIGEFIEVKYKVEKPNTKLWVRDMAGRVVHEQGYTMNPYPAEYERPDRINTYQWRLYKSQYSNYIQPGEYEIIVGTNLNSSQNYYLNIEI